MIFIKLAQERVKADVFALRLIADLVSLRIGLAFQLLLGSAGVGEDRPRFRTPPDS